MDSTKSVVQLIGHFQELVPLDDGDIATLLPKLEVKKLNKKEYVLQPGQVSRHMRFIAEGSMRVYYLDEKNQEHTLQLGIENWWVNDLYSYFSGKPSRMFIQANEATTLMQISKTNLETLYKEVPRLSDFFRMKTQAAYVVLQERTIEHMSVDAYTRYNAFISEYRQLEQRFPQYMIASYLGVTPEFLSYLRKKRIPDVS
jgi:CRP-like cAMP-binding protein